MSQADDAEQAERAKSAAAAQGAPFAGLAAAGLVKPVRLNSPEWQAILRDCERQMQAAVEELTAATFEEK